MTTLTPELQSLANQLCHSLREQIAICQQAWEIAKSIPARIEQGLDPSEPIRRLGEHMDLLAKVEQRSAAARQRWQTDPRPKSADVEKLVAAAAGALEELLAAVNAAEEAAATAKSHLSPTLAEATRQHQMRKAYGSAAGS